MSNACNTNKLYSVIMTHAIKLNLLRLISVKTYIVLLKKIQSNRADLGSQYEKIYICLDM